MTGFRRRFSSIRWQLTLLYASVLVASCLLLGLMVDRLAEAGLQSEFDRGLEDTASALARALDAAFLENPSPTPATLGEELAEAGVPAGTALRLEVPGQPELRLGWDAAPSMLHFDPSASSLAGAPALRTLAVAGKTLRVLDLERETGGRPRYRLTVVRDCGPVARHLALLRRAFFAALIPLVVLSAAVGFLLAGRVLSPVGRMARQAQQVQANGLDQRLDVDNPASEFGRLALVLNDLFTRLQAAFEQQRQFLADAAHELRTPVAALRAQADVTLRHTRSAPEYAEALQDIREQTAYLSQIVDDLLFMARAEAAQIVLRAEPTDLMEVIDETCRRLFPIASAREIRLNWSFDDEFRVEIDPHLVSRALTNLIANALHHTPSGGSVTVTLDRRPDLYRIAVADTGPGVPETDLPQLFDRFFRGSNASTESGDGLGMGLAIVRAIMDLHRGAVRVENLPTTGSVFSLEFPSRPAASEPNRLEGIDQPAMRAALTAAGPPARRR